MLKFLHVILFSSNELLFARAEKHCTSFSCTQKDKGMRVSCVSFKNLPSVFPAWSLDFLNKPNNAENIKKHTTKQCAIKNKLKNQRVKTKIRSPCLPVTRALRTLRQQDGCEFKASLGYNVSSRPIWTLQWNLVTKKTKKNHWKTHLEISISLLLHTHLYYNVCVFENFIFFKCLTTGISVVMELWLFCISLYYLQ